MAMNLESIARRAGVSAATVSLALNNRHGVSRLTREKILGIVREVGYKKRPSRAIARGAVQFLKLIRHGHTLNDTTGRQSKTGAGVGPAVSC